MLGASLYLSEGLENNLDYIEQMNEKGIKTLFTSLHIPENDSSKTLKQLKELTSRMNSHGMKLITDVSTHTLEMYEIEKNETKQFFKDLGITHLRIDYGFSYKEIKNLSGEFAIVLNASTVDNDVCNELENVGVSLKNISVCHNFYPRENTALSRHALFERNHYLKEKGFNIMAFIPGNDKRRGPVYAGLPTIEEHRYKNPLEAYLDLTEHLLVDDVLIGDISMNEMTLDRIQEWIEHSVVSLDLKEVSEELPNNFYEIHSNRKDFAADVIRSSESRPQLKNTVIEPMNNIPRPEGTVTLDNKEYGRYSGEIQITKKDLREDERVNVLGKVKKEDLGLLKYIVGEIKFKFRG